MFELFDPEKIDLPAMKNHFQMTNDQLQDLMQKPYIEVLTLYKQMLAEKHSAACQKANADPETIRRIVKFFAPYNMLAMYFTQDEIISAIIDQINKGHSNITQETPVPTGRRIPYPNAEFLRTETVTVPDYDRNGKQYLYGKQQLSDIYLTAAQYQSTCHGPIIQQLLYTKYPQLIPFHLSCYGYDSFRDYEVYPKNNIYTPFHALMQKDIEAIKERNRKYAKSYNNGIYTPAKTEKRLTSPEAEHYFDVIRNL